MLLSIVSVDKNSIIFPTSMEVVEKENKEAWARFSRCVRIQFGEGNTETIMTDKQKGILVALEQELPRAKVRLCNRHILANIKTKVKHGTIPRQWYLQVVRATYYVVFKNAMDKIQATNSAVWNCLRNVPLHNWARHAFDTTCKADHYTNNRTENWSSTLGKLRRGFVLALLEGMIAVRNREVTTSANPTPRLILSRLEKAAKTGRDFDRRWVWFQKV